MWLGILLIIGLAVFSVVEIVALVRDIRNKKKLKDEERNESEKDN